MPTYPVRHRLPMIRYPIILTAHQEDTMADKKKVIVTGFGGRIGKVLRDHLGDKYEFSGIDRVPLDGLDSLTADLTDLDAIAPAFEGVDVVIHLAAEPRHTPDIGWDLLMPDNVIATANVFEAARAAVSAASSSSSHARRRHVRARPAIQGNRRRRLRRPRPRRSPPNHPQDARQARRPYAVSKIFGEALGRYFWEDHRISVICIRFGTTAPDDRPGSDARSLVSYFSHRDIAAMVEACIEAQDVGFDIFYGASANTWKIYDTPRAWEVLGFQARDNAERFR